MTLFKMIAEKLDVKTDDIDGAAVDNRGIGGPSDSDSGRSSSNEVLVQTIRDTHF